MIRKRWRNTITLASGLSVVLLQGGAYQRGTVENTVEKQRSERLGKEEGAGGRSGMLGKKA